MTTKYIFLSFLKWLATNHLSKYWYEKLLWRSQVHNLNISTQNKPTTSLQSTELFIRSFSLNAMTYVTI